MVYTGLDQLEAEDFSRFSGLRVGLLANQAAVNSSMTHALDICRASRSIKLIKLFAPEHGFFGALQDMAAVDHCIEPGSKISLISLYGSTEESLVPKEEDLKDLDLLLVDLPDIGTRYYTFAQTLGYCMKVAARTGTKVAVLDRPNPLNGLDIEGAALESYCRSFCGYASIANRHGLTLGELACVMNRGFGEQSFRIDPLNCDLEIIPLSGWTRDMYFDQTGLPWVMPSPNMPTLDTALVYPGTCLFEATTVSEGRGCTRPFEIIGAPYIDGSLWAKETKLLGIGLEGASLRPLSFEPQFHKWAKITCGGLQIHVTDRRRFKPFRLGLALLYTLARLYPAEFALRPDAYEFVDKVPAIDLLFGSDGLRKTLFSGELKDLLEELSSFEAWYKQARKEFLLY